MPNDILTPHQINKNRIIDMTISDSSLGVKGDWRYNLSRLSEMERAKKGYKMITQDISNNLIVSSDVYLLLSEAKGISIKAGTSTPIADVIGKLSNTKVGMVATALTGVASLADAAANAIENDDGSTSGTFMPWGQNIIAWNGTGAISLNYKFEFHMGQFGLWNAKEEVIKPILCLVAPVLPQHLNSFMQYGPFPNAWGMVANVIKDVIKGATKRKGGGDSSSSSSGTSSGSQTEGDTPPSDIDNVMNTIDEGSEDNFFSKIGEFLEDILVASYKRYTFDIRFGNYMILNKMLMTDCKVAFSNEMDDKGYPVAGTADCTFEGILPPAYSTSTIVNRGIRFGADADVVPTAASGFITHV